MATSVNPPLTSPNPFDSIDTFFHPEEDILIESHPLNPRKKRAREEGDTVGSSISIQRRHSTRNPRIGLGFNKKPDNPVEIVDEDADGDNDDDNDDDDDDDDEEQEDSPIISGQAGLPLHPTLRRALLALGLAPLQISPWFWKHLVGFLVLWKEQCEIDNLVREPGYDEIGYIFCYIYPSSDSNGYHLNPPATLPTPPTTLPTSLATHSSLSEMVARAARILGSSRPIQKQPVATPPVRPVMIPQQVQKQTTHLPSLPSTTSTRRQLRVGREKNAGTVIAPPTNQPLSSQLWDRNLEEVVAWFMKAFKFSVAMEKQVNAFREAVTSAKAELEDAKQDLAQSETSIDFLNRALTEAEMERDTALADLERLKLALKLETLKSLSRQVERESVKAKRNLLLDENRFLRATVRDLEARIYYSFGDGYFYAAYQTGPSLSATAPDPSLPQEPELPASNQARATAMVLPDPPVIQGEQVEDAADSTGPGNEPVKKMKIPADSEVPGAEEVQADAGAKVMGEADVAGQEEDAGKK
ncbi:hypothetical protein Q3G72_023114 [Acer saccharum]|nr:hypothetical protein Q3G72_023114 [Acer saccharum]